MAIFGTIGVQGVDGTLATTIRAIIMAVVLFVVVLSRCSLAQAGTIERRAIVFIVLSGLAGTASWVCYFRALQLGDALRVAPIECLSGGVTLVLTAALLHERAPVSAWLGTGLMLLGAVIVSSCLLDTALDVARHAHTAGTAAVRARLASIDSVRRRLDTL